MSEAERQDYERTIAELRRERDKWYFHAQDLYRALLVQRGFTFHTATAQGAEERYEKAVRGE